MYQYIVGTVAIIQMTSLNDINVFVRLIFSLPLLIRSYRSPRICDGSLPIRSETKFAVTSRLVRSFGLGVNTFSMYPPPPKNAPIVSLKYISTI